MATPDTFISIDLETTGLDPQFSTIIEIGAVKVSEGAIVDEFEALVNPRGAVPEHITRLTGISQADVDAAEPIEFILPGLLDFMRGHRLVAQNAQFDISFLRKAAGAGNVETAIDTIDMARIMLPTLHSYSLDNLIEFFALSPATRHRALEDARMTAIVYLKLYDMMKMLPDHLLKDLSAIAAKGSSPLKEVLEYILFDRIENPEPIVTSEISDLAGAGAPPDNRYGDFDSEPPPPEPSPSPLDPDDVQNVLASAGPLSRFHEGYEERPGQMAMAKRITHAFNESELLLAEAGTGTGKSLAYLVPAVLWAHRHTQRVVISTNTKNLQEQLFTKDIPLLGRILNIDYRAVMLKGRGNYICLSRWRSLVHTNSQYLSRQERDFMLPVTTWLMETKTGDLSETGFFSQLAECGLLERINSESTTCKGGRCGQRNKCFVTRVRKAAQQSHLIVVNHSLVFSDMASDGSVLGKYTHIIFDEAHNIEKVALQFLGVTFDYSGVRRVLNRLYNKQGSGFGLFAILLDWVEQARKVDESIKDHGVMFARCVELVGHVRQLTIELIKLLHQTVSSSAPNTGNGKSNKVRYEQNCEIFALSRATSAEYMAVFKDLLDALSDAITIVNNTEDALMDRREDHLIELNDAYERLLLVINNFAFLLDAQGANVFWFEYNTDNPLFFRIKSAPLDIAEKLAFGLYDQMETVIMTSATLAVARDFGYISERLGLALDQRERLRTFIADSPFDHIRQSALVVPTFLPSPNEGDFIDETGELLYEIACGARRGMLVLFTSRGHLYRAYYDLRDRFTREGITLLAQGVDGSRSLLLRRFKEEPKSVLFGTDSFWEGVDVPGAALEIVVISKLPFAVPSEPVIQAQMEEIEKTGGNPFMEYSVPSAAIKLRQGAGRLIRHRKDRGVIVLFDKRVHTKRYGSLFLRSLPGKELRAENRNRVVEQITGWFSRLD